jgi:hypothetical protein
MDLYHLASMIGLYETSRIKSLLVWHVSDVLIPYTEAG